MEFHTGGVLHISWERHSLTLHKGWKHVVMLCACIHRTSFSKPIKIQLCCNWNIPAERDPLHTGLGAYTETQESLKTPVTYRYIHKRTRFEYSSLSSTLSVSMRFITIQRVQPLRMIYVHGAAITLVSSYTNSSLRSLNSHCTHARPCERTSKLKFFWNIFLKW